jgi:Tol biopolymer transport system component
VTAKNLRKRWRSVVLSIGFAALLTQCSSEPPAYPGGDLPGTTPVIFAPGIVSGDAIDFTPAFSPDMKELFFTVLERSHLPKIMHMTYGKDGWSTPELAPFSGFFVDGSPAFSPDGNTLFFVSNRPLEIDGFLKDFDIWKIERTKDGWSEPIDVGPPVNSGADERGPSVAGDGTLYFQSDANGGMGENDLYKSEIKNGKYQMPENLGPGINTARSEADPAITRDGKTLVFYAFNRPGEIGGGDLYISTFVDGVWSEARSLGSAINTPGEENFPVFSPDNTVLFFTSDRAPDREFSDIFWIQSSAIGVSGGK